MMHACRAEDTAKPPNKPHACDNNVLNCPPPWVSEAWSTKKQKNGLSLWKPNPHTTLSITIYLTVSGQVSKTHRQTGIVRQRTRTKKKHDWLIVIRHLTDSSITKKPSPPSRFPSRPSHPHRCICPPRVRPQCPSTKKSLPNKKRKTTFKKINNKLSPVRYPREHTIDTEEN